MLTFQKMFKPQSNFFLPAGFQPEEILYFDIETTGLSADTSSLYLIGCLYYREQTWQTIQWFAEDYGEESSLLTAFFTFLKEFKILIHYNGTGFDLPYLQKKCRRYALSYSFDEIQSLDIYKVIFPYRKLLPLENIKQKTLEHSLGLFREDMYTGGELISVYGDYIHKRIKKEENTEYLLELLLLHNREDLEGLYVVSSLLLLPEVTFMGNWQFQLKLPYQLSYPLSLENKNLRLTIEKEQGTLTLLPFFGTLKYFYADYKNYYYLPMEDVAIHKSVAAYVEKDYRQRANAKNCYTKRDGCFLPVQKGFLLPCDTPLFYLEFKDKTAYFEVAEDFCNDTERVLSYVKASLLSL